MTSALAQSLSGLTISPSSVVGGSRLTGTVSLTKNAPSGGFVVTLQSNQTAATTPTSVKVPAGDDSTSFAIDTTPVAAATPAKITATASGAAKAAGFTIKPATVSALAITPTTVIGGAGATGKVTLTGSAPTGGLSVQLYSNSGAATVPSGIIVTAGSASATFSITTTPVGIDRSVSITAKANGTNQTGSMTVQAAVLKSVSFGPSTLPGGNATTGTVTLTGKTNAGGLIVDLSSTATAVPVPKAVKIAAGSSSASFKVTTVPVASDAMATVTASVGASMTTAEVTVKAPTMTRLSFSNWVILAGQRSNCIVGLTSEAPAGGLTFPVSTDATGVTVPSSVTVPAGKTSAQFPVLTPISNQGATVVVDVAGSLADLSVYGVGVNPSSAWPKFGGNLANTGLGAGMGAVGVQQWSFPTTATIEGTVAIGPTGTLFVGADNGNLYAVNPDGTSLWTESMGAYSLSSAAVAADGSIYIGAGNNLMAYNTDGSVRWKFATGNWVKSSPTIGVDGTVYVGSQDDSVYAVNLAGKQVWKFATAGPVLSSPAIGSDGTIYVGSEDFKLYALAQSGTKKWVFKTGGKIDSSPAIGPDGTIYVGCNDGNLYAIDSSGKKKWAFAAQSGLNLNSPAIDSNGTVYFGAVFDGNLYSVSTSGKLNWSIPIGEMAASPSIGGDGTIYVGSRDHHVYAINPDGSTKWSVLMTVESDSTPCIGSDGTIYIGFSDGLLHAIK